jgi:hypothetical protein
MKSLLSFLFLAAASLSPAQVPEGVGQAMAANGLTFRNS